MATRHPTLEDTRRIAVRAKLLDADRAAHPVEVADQPDALKIDPTTAIAPCEHSMLRTRIGFPSEQEERETVRTE
ncbi:MAG: hypothetical protein HIU86_05545 [Acidobacteria bacterium]|nr:hypothetical protein [Acidobacteriota bacterium]